MEDDDSAEEAANDDSDENEQVSEHQEEDKDDKMRIDEAFTTVLVLATLALALLVLTHCGCTHSVRVCL